MSHFSERIGYGEESDLLLHKKFSTDVNQVLTFVSFNCGSVTNKINKVMDFVIENEIDVSMFQETWLEKKVFCFTSRNQRVQFRNPH